MLPVPVVLRFLRFTSQCLLWRKQTLRFCWPAAASCPAETLVVLKREAIFGQFLSLIQDEIRGSYRTIAANYG
jgi:hypothetical protein